MSILVSNRFLRSNYRNIYAILQIIQSINSHLTIFMIKIPHKSKCIRIRPGML